MRDTIFGVVSYTHTQEYIVEIQKIQSGNRVRTQCDHNSVRRKNLKKLTSVVFKRNLKCSIIVEGFV